MDPPRTTYYVVSSFAFTTAHRYEGEGDQPSKIKAIYMYLGLSTVLLLTPRPVASFAGPKIPCNQRYQTAPASIRSPPILFTSIESKDPSPEPPPIGEVLEVRLEGNQFIQSSIITFLPIVIALSSFFTFPVTSQIFHDSVQFLSNNSWQAVDGGELQWEILLPALNGVVMTAISILFANLISTTGITLRNRQVAVHSSLNSETEDIRGLIMLIDYYPESMRESFRSCLRRYIIMIVEELQPGIDIAKVRVSNNYPILDYNNNLHDLSVSKEDDGSESINPAILQQSYDSIQRIISWRTNRVTALQSTFPMVQYVTIISLMFAMLTVFLIETDRDLILFLNNFQIRLVWSMLNGTFTAIQCIGYDLNNPFVGTYQVPDILDEGDPIITNLFEGEVTVQRRGRYSRQSS